MVTDVIAILGNIDLVLGEVDWRSENNQQVK
jgi:NADH:ubiquinone oxidoreductase subunit D